MLELEFVVLGELTRAAKIGGLPLLFELDLFAERIPQPALDQIDGEIGDIDADPFAPEFLRRVNGGAASAKWIEHDIPRIAARADDAFEKGLRFLCREAETLLSLRVDGRDVRPNVAEWFTSLFIEVALETRHFTWGGLDHQTLGVCLRHSLLCPSPNAGHT